MVLLSVALCACASKIGRGGGGASTLSQGKNSSGSSAGGSPTQGPGGAPGAVPGQGSSPGGDNESTANGRAAGQLGDGSTRVAGADGSVTNAGVGQDGRAVNQPGGAARKGTGEAGGAAQSGVGEQGGGASQPGGTAGGAAGGGGGAGQSGGTARAAAGGGGATTPGGTGGGGLSADGTNADGTTINRLGDGSTRSAGGATSAGAGAVSAATTRSAAAGGGAGGTNAEGSDQLADGTIGAPGSRAKVEEEVTAQTLDGLLPLVVGVDEQGQFDFDQAVLRPEVKVRLDELAAKLDGAQFDRLDIIGYADPIGTEDYNQQLSERRAWAVARYLLEKSVPLKKMKVEGRGQRNSLVPEGACSGLDKSQMIACVQKDRRVEIEASIRKTNVKVQ